MVSCWVSKKKKETDPDYHESLAHTVKDIILGSDHVSHAKRRKRAVKALQNDVTALGMITYLKAMPDPSLPSVEVTVIEEDNSPPPLPPRKDKSKESSIKTKEKVVVGGSTGVSTSLFKPPLDQISAYAFWWGYEIYIPQQCMGRLDQAQNVSNAFVGFLQVIAGNASAISPYFGFISAWVGLQFTVIKAQNAGHGVVLAATW
ncbi:13450_t:CDS:1 [Acaulospora morrowiae]|uniref:13450_t:CDS:1 n=1 Tax=Acaulospora morrowiae TaxID=94023 RepID=A0A9N9GBM5_9GLOM|nr:13450_t:CDS:1 [Acaulospora morrowiae]